MGIMTPLLRRYQKTFYLHNLTFSLSPMNALLLTKMCILSLIVTLNVKECLINIE